MLPPVLLARYVRRILSSLALARNKKTVVVSMAQYGVDINRVAALMVAERALSATIPQRLGSLRGSTATELDVDPIGMMSGMPTATTHVGPAPSPAPAATDLGTCSAEENATTLASAILAPVAQAAAPAVINASPALAANPTLEALTRVGLQLGAMGVATAVGGVARTCSKRRTAASTEGPTPEQQQIAQLLANQEELAKKMAEVLEEKARTHTLAVGHVQLSGGAASS